MASKKGYETGRKYRNCWESTFPWVTQSSTSTTMAKCKLCQIDLRPHKGNLEQHQKSASHLARDRNLNKKQAPLQFAKIPTVSTLSKEADIHLALSICCHTSVSTIDHLGEIIALYSKGSCLEGLKLHRTKCTQLIQNVISPSFEEEVESALKNKQYSVMVDESTDVSADKHLCVCVQYFSEKENKVIDDYIGIVSVISATGENLFLALKEKLASVGLSLINCIGYSSDGASNVVGEYNSVWSRVKDESKNCIMMKCTCHSLHLIVQHAFEVLPSNIGFLLSEIPAFFSKSTLRRDEFLRLFQELDPDQEKKGSPTPFQKYSATRWLVRGKILYNLLVNWSELKAYFTKVEVNATASVRLKIRLILEMLNDQAVYLYFVFITPIVQEFERMNAMFQGANVDPEKLVQELFLHHKSIHQRVFDTRGYQLPLPNVDFGAKFSTECHNFIKSHPTEEQDRVTLVNNVKNRCQKFILELVSQMEKRLPENKNVFQGLSNLAPSKVLSQINKVPFSALPLPHLIQKNAQEIEDQYRKINHIDWAETELFKDDVIPKDSVKFWSMVRCYKDLENKHSFRELADYCLTCLSLPISNAYVEKVFSRVSFVKSKQRNSMSTKMLDSIVRVKSFLSNREMCCKDFKVTLQMLSKFTSEMYNKPSRELEPEELEILECLE